MENVADALKMAATILIFIIAIASSFSLFGIAKQTADSIITMRDKQAYLDAAELDNGILYTSTEAIQGETGLTDEQIEDQLGVNTYGNRIVGKDDVIATIYRYNKEKYGVTIIKKVGSTGTVIARFDSNTENVMRMWNNITDGENSKGEIITAQTQKEKYRDKIKENISSKNLKADQITLDLKDLEDLYEIKVEGNDNITCGAPWYGNNEEIQERINKELSGKEYELNGQSYQPKQALGELLSKENIKITEIINEIDESKYLKDENKETEDKSTTLLQQYEMPTVEIVYIIE